MSNMTTLQRTLSAASTGKWNSTNDETVNGVGCSLARGLAWGKIAMPAQDASIHGRRAAGKLFVRCPSFIAAACADP
jgi:hypothetical protein